MQALLPTLDEIGQSGYDRWILRDVEERHVETSVDC
jgi:hypothetical protein